MKTNQREEQKN